MKKKKIYIITASTLLLLAAIVIGGGFFMLDYSLKPDHGGKDIEDSYKYMFKEYPGLETWIDSINSENALKDTFILSNSGIRLHAYHLAASHPTKKTAVLVHGYTDNAVRMLMIAQLYNQKLGYNVLLPDLQNSGLSGGDHFQMGWLDRIDVMKWMDVANKTFGDSTKMVVHGISMGAATTMMVSGEKQASYVKCYIEDCGYTSVWDEFTHKLKDGFGLPSFPLMNITSYLCKQKYGWSFKDASALEHVKKCELPMLFIHGDADTYVPTRMVNELFASKQGDKELWIVPGAIHAMSYRDNTQEYTERVKNFTDRYIN